eukprot:gene543-10227_t
MTEARRCEICLLDDRKLEILVQPKLLVKELIDIAASHFTLREKEYFGLWYMDGKNQKRWLRDEKKVLEHGFSKTVAVITLIFGVRLYVQSITHLKDASTIELFFLQAAQLIYQDEVECDTKTTFLLAAYVLQATNGDYVSVEKVALHYKRMSGLPRGDAIVNFLSIVERLSTYGVHFFDAKDKNDVPWRLGVSHRGIGQYYPTDHVTAKKTYMWSRMDNLFYRDKKFSIEIRDLTRYATLRARQAQSVVDTWYFSTTIDAREIWSVSVGYHQLLVNSKDLQRFQAVRTLKDIAKELTKSSSSLATSIDSEFTGSTFSGDGVWYDQEDAESVYMDFISALRSKKEMLEMRLKEREEELKDLSRQEAELTAAYRARKDTIDQSVGATFHFSEDVLKNLSSNEEMEKLTRDYEIQSQITAAAKRLAFDPKAKRKMRKERRILYDKAVAKLREIEGKVKTLKRSHKTNTGSQNNGPEKDDRHNSEDSNVDNGDDEFETDFPYQPFSLQMPEAISAMSRRANTFSATGRPDDYYGTLRGSLQKFRNGSVELSPSSRKMVSSRYVIGDFDSSGIYSGLRDKRTNMLVDQYKSMHVSNSLTQIPKLTQQYSNTASSSCDELETKSNHVSDNHSENEYYRNVQADELRNRILNLNNGPIIEDSSYFPYNGPATKYTGNTSRTPSVSLLSGAAWNQLSQPSMDRLPPEVVSSYTGIGMSPELDVNDYYLEEESILERLAQDLILENDEEREESLV